jgi:hypothetical protein
MRGKPLVLRDCIGEAKVRRLPGFTLPDGCPSNAQYEGLR